MGQNQHYISKVQTKPWESAQKKLHYFDFGTKQIAEEFADKLFAKTDLWPEKLEKIFHKRFESHFKDEIKRFSKNEPGKNGQTPYRHILLMHLFTVMRNMKAHHDIATIETFSKLSNEKLDREIEEFLRPNEIVGIPVNPAYRMFFSEHGFFHIPLTMSGTSEMSVGFAVPVHPSLAFGIFPKGYDQNGLIELVESNEAYFLKLSVGFSGQRLVIHPDLVTNEPKLIDKILFARDINQRAASLVQSSSEALRIRINQAVQNMRIKGT
jgi:hypothetical protein